jgi:hypothetical protein
MLNSSIGDLQSQLLEYKSKDNDSCIEEGFYERLGKDSVFSGEKRKEYESNIS